MEIPRENGFVRNGMRWIAFTWQPLNNYYELAMASCLYGPLRGYQPTDGISKLLGHCMTGSLLIGEGFGGSSKIPLMNKVFPIFFSKSRAPIMEKRPVMIAH